MLEKSWKGRFEKCVKCGSPKFEQKAMGFCIKCYREHLRRKCDFCGKLNVTSTRKGGKIVCVSCNKKYFYNLNKRECSICKKIKRIDKIMAGKPICISCNKKYFYEKPKDVCGFCGELKIRDGYRDGNPICCSCYKKLYYKGRPKKICDNCGRLGYIDIIIDNKNFCRKCYTGVIKKEHYLALSHKRRTRIKGNGGNISEIDFKQILDRDKKCVYCGNEKNLTFDHIIPVSKGGKSDINNYVIACFKCNLSKGKKDVLNWCKWKGINVPEIIETLLKNVR